MWTNQWHPSWCPSSLWCFLAPHPISLLESKLLCFPCHSWDPGQYQLAACALSLTLLSGFSLLDISGCSADSQSPSTPAALGILIQMGIYSPLAANTKERAQKMLHHMHEDYPLYNPCNNHVGLRKSYDKNERLAFVMDLINLQALKVNTHKSIPCGCLCNCCSYHYFKILNPR